MKKLLAALLVSLSLSLSLSCLAQTKQKKVVRKLKTQGKKKESNFHSILISAGVGIGALAGLLILNRLEKTSKPKLKSFDGDEDEKEIDMATEVSKPDPEELGRLLKQAKYESELKKLRIEFQRTKSLAKLKEFEESDKNLQRRKSVHNEIKGHFLRRTLKKEGAEKFLEEISRIEGHKMSLEDILLGELSFKNKDEDLQNQKKIRRASKILGKLEEKIRLLEDDDEDDNEDDNEDDDEDV